MHSLLRGPYAAIGLLAEAGAAVAPPGNAKWLRALRARRGVTRRFRAFAPQRDTSRQLVWFHAPSVGECLLTVPVARILRAEEPAPQIAVTWYSPSAEAFVDRIDADFGDYLPFDTTRAAREALDALRPSALVFANLDVWPVLAREASRRGVRLGLVSAMMRAGSSRMTPLARGLLHDAYSSLDLVGAIGEPDAARLVKLGVRPEAIQVTGDSRYDQAWNRAQRANRPQPFLPAGPPTLVAGSTWKTDESVLLPAWDRVRTLLPDARLVIAPHEPTRQHLAPIASWASSRGWRVETIDGPSVSGADLVLVNRIGILADLYAEGAAAYVGGGFHAAGVHSVLEPAALGRPVVFGPRGRDNAEAARLLKAGGGVAVDDHDALAETLREWLGSPHTCALAGEAARGVVRDGLGAAGRSAGLVRSLLAQGAG